MEESDEHVAYRAPCCGKSGGPSLPREMRTQRGVSGEAYALGEGLGSSESNAGIRSLLRMRGAFTVVSTVTTKVLPWALMSSSLGFQPFASEKLSDAP